MFGLSVSPLLRQFSIVVSVNLAVFSIGMDLAWTSPVLVKLKDGNQTSLVEPPTAAEESWIISAGFLTSIFANFIPPLLMDSIGRKSCLILSYVPHIAAGLLFLVASRAWFLILGRILTGISISMAFTVCPTYVAEIASQERRGGLGTLLQMFCCIGIVIILSIGPFITYQTLSIVYLAVVILSAIPSFIIPESPYFLYSKGKSDKALQLLCRLRGSEVLAKQEIEEYRLADAEKIIDKKALLKDTVFLKTIAIVMCFAMLGHFSGASAIIYYLQSILDSTKTSVSSEVSSGVIGALKVVATLVSALITDRFGRIPILIWSWSGKAIGMVGLGTYFYLKSPDMSIFVNYIPVSCIILVVFCHNAGQNALFYIIIAEFFEGPSRAIGVTSAILSASIFNFLLAMYLGPVLTILGPAIVYWCFGAISVIGIVFTKAFMPETKGKSFAEIQEKLGRRRQVTS